MDLGSGFYDDDGNEINPDLVPRPPLCLICKRNDWGGMEEILCTMNRLDQRDDEEFKCGVFEPVSGK